MASHSAVLVTAVLDVRYVGHVGCTGTAVLDSSCGQKGLRGVFPDDDFFLHTTITMLLMEGTTLAHLLIVSSEVLLVVLVDNGLLRENRALALVSSATSSVWFSLPIWNIRLANHINDLLGRVLFLRGHPVSTIDAFYQVTCVCIWSSS